MKKTNNEWGYEDPGGHLRLLISFDYNNYSYESPGFLAYPKMKKKQHANVFHKNSNNGLF